MGAFLKVSLSAAKTRRDREGRRREGKEYGRTRTRGRRFQTQLSTTGTRYIEYCVETPVGRTIPKSGGQTAWKDIERTRIRSGAGKWRC